jgi:GH24 family phage-related lysozyme (muramidase)
MPEIFRFNPGDMGKPTVQGGDVANAFFNTFFAARQDARAEQGMENETTRLGMAQDQFQQQTEDRAWDNTNLRPLQLQSAELGIANQRLGLQSAQQGITLKQMQIGDQLQRKAMLQGILQDMVGAGNNSTQPAPGDEDLVTRVKGMEGFKSTPYGDYRQTSIGYGTRAQAGDTTLDEATADARLRSELAGHASRVDNYAAQKGFQLTPNQRHALISFDFNTGDAPRVLERSGGDLSKVPAIMQEWRMAGGQVNQGLVNRRAKEAAWFNGTQATDIAGTSGVPLYVEAAGSPNPGQVINQAFTSRQQKFLSHYDTLKMLAVQGQGTADGMQAAMMVQQLEMNPEFQATLGARDTLLTSARNQAAITQGIMAARQDQLVDFTSAFPQYGFTILPDSGQVMVKNGYTGMPLNPQEQMAFGAAWQNHGESFKYKLNHTSPDSLGDTVLKEYARQKGIWAAGKDVTGTDDESMKLKRASAGAEQAIKAMESAEPKLAAIRLAEEAQAAKDAARVAAETAKNGGTPPPPTAPAKTISGSSERKAQVRDTSGDADWTVNKERFGKSFLTTNPDTGKEDPAANPALAAAMDIYRGNDELATGKEANEAFPTMGYPDHDFPIGLPKSHVILKRAGIEPMGIAFEQERAGSNGVSNNELARAWATDLLVKYGYLDAKGKPVTGQAGERPLTPEEKAYMDKRAK